MQKCRCATVSWKYFVRAGCSVFDARAVCNWYHHTSWWCELSIKSTMWGASSASCVVASSTRAISSCSAPTRSSTAACTTNIATPLSFSSVPTLTTGSTYRANVTAHYRRHRIICKSNIAKGSRNNQAENCTLWPTVALKIIQEYRQLNTRQWHKANIRNTILINLLTCLLSYLVTWDWWVLLDGSTLKTSRNQFDLQEVCSKNLKFIT